MKYELVFHCLAIIGAELWQVVIGSRLLRQYHCLLWLLYYFFYAFSDGINWDRDPNQNLFLLHSN